MTTEDHEVQIPGVVGRVSVQMASLFGAAKILIDGQPAPVGSKRGRFVLRRENGSEVEATFKQTMSRTVPSVIVDGTTYEAGEAIPIPLVVLLFAPFALIGLGGCLGGVFGGLAFAANSVVVRSNLATPIKVAVMLGVGGAASIVYLVVAMILQAALSG